MDDKFVMHCIKCKTQEGLQMVAHRLNDGGGMVGWVFACRVCAPIIYSSRVAIQYPPFEDDEK